MSVDVCFISLHERDQYVEVGTGESTILKVLMYINLYNHSQDYSKSVCLIRTRRKQTVLRPKKVLNSSNTQEVV